MEKVLGRAEGIVAILVQQSVGEFPLPCLPTPAFLPEGGLKILVGQMIPMGKLIFISGTWNRANKPVLETISGPVRM